MLKNEQIFKILRENTPSIISDSVIDEEVKKYKLALKLQEKYSKILSERQFLIFLLKETGITVKAIAKLLEIAESTVYNAFRVAEKKMILIQEYCLKTICGKDYTYSVLDRILEE